MRLLLFERGAKSIRNTHLGNLKSAEEFFFHKYAFARKKQQTYFIVDETSRCMYEYKYEVEKPEGRWVKF